MSISSVIHWTAMVRRTGDARPWRVGGDKQSKRIEAYAKVIVAAVDQKADITLAELRDLLAQQGLPVAISAIEATGPQLLFLPPYSSELNPIEIAFSKLRALLRKAAARTVDQLWAVIGQGLDAFAPPECANYFAAAGYDAR